MAGRAVVLHGVLDPGDRPDEADTLVQAREVRERLEELGWRCEVLACGLDLRPVAELVRDPPDLVFYLVEALAGRAGLQHLPAALLEVAGIPFTGAPAAALQLTTDKLVAKRLLRRYGLPTPDWLEPGQGAERDGLWIVKAVDEDASLGLDAGSVVPGSGLAARLAAMRARFGGRWFAEAFIEGREFNLPMLEGPDGPEILPIGEIDFTRYPNDRPRIVDYDAKWTPGSLTYETTPRSFTPRPGDGPLRARLVALARAAWDLFGLRGYARIDFRVDREGRPWILEVNADPCLSADAGFVAAAEEAGLDQRGLVARIVAAALSRHRGAGDGEAGARRSRANARRPPGAAALGVPSAAGEGAW